MFAASPPVTSNSTLSLLQASPANDNDLDLPPNDGAFSNDNQAHNNLVLADSTLSQSQSRPGGTAGNGPGGSFSRFDPTPYTFGSEATSLEYSMLSSMLNDIDPSLIGGNGNGTPDWNQLSPHTHYSENSDEYRLNRYDGVAAPSGLNPASISGTSISGATGGQVNAEGGQDLQNGDARSRFNETIASEEAMDGFTNWTGDSNSNQDEISKFDPPSATASTNRKSSRNSRSRNNNNHFLPSITSLSNPASIAAPSHFKASSSIISTSLLSDSSASLKEDAGAPSSSSQIGGESSYPSASNPTLNEDEREPTSAALTDSQARARHASVFDPDPHSISPSAWKERVGKVYSQKIKPFPYTEGYHFLLKHCTEK